MTSGDLNALAERIERHLGHSPSALLEAQSLRTAADHLDGKADGDGLTAGELRLHGVVVYWKLPDTVRTRCTREMLERSIDERLLTEDRVTRPTR